MIPREWLGPMEGMFIEESLDVYLEFIQNQHDGPM
jgi:hypothetical protein